MYKRWAIIALILLAVLFVGSAAVTYLVDPFQAYRVATRFTPLFDNGMEPYFNAGLARHYDYDTIMLGTSMTENFRPSYIDEKFGGQSIKLPFEGGMAGNHEQALKLALKTHDVKRVFYGMDMYSFVRKPDFSSFFMPEYLYDNNPFNDVEYLLNGEVLFHQIPSVIWHNWREPGKLQMTRDSLYAWKPGVVYGQEAVLSSYDFSAPAVPMQPVEDYLENVAQNFAKYVQPYLKDHPDVEFIFFFPPYGSLQWYIMQQNGHLDFVLATKEALTEALLPYPNVKLFDFTARLDWIENFDLYCDYAHHSPEINQWMTDAMAAGENQVGDIFDVYEANDVLVDVAANFPVPAVE